MSELPVGNAFTPLAAECFILIRSYIHFLKVPMNEVWDASSKDSHWLKFIGNTLTRAISRTTFAYNSYALFLWLIGRHLTCMGVSWSRVLSLIGAPD